MKKYMYALFLTGCIGMILSGCGQNEAKKEYDFANLAQPSTDSTTAFADAEITIPAGLVGEEVTDDHIAYVDERTAQVTYSLSGTERDSIVDQLSDEIAASISVILADKEHYPNITAIAPNADYTEFTITLTDGNMNTYESMLAMSFYIVGDKYQIYSGVPTEETVTVVRYVNSSTGAVISETDSTSMQNG